MRRTCTENVYSTEESEACIVYHAKTNIFLDEQLLR